MPDKRGAQAHRHRQKRYKLFKEGYVHRVFVKANINMVNTTMFLVKCRVSASMKQQSYVVYLHLSQQTGNVYFAACNCKLEKGGCCKHVAALLYMIWNYSRLELKIIPDDLTCTQVSQKWNLPYQDGLKVEEAVDFNDLSFEKADFKRILKTLGRDPLCLLLGTIIVQLLHLPKMVRRMTLNLLPMPSKLLVNGIYYKKPNLKVHVSHVINFILLAKMT